MRRVPQLKIRGADVGPGMYISAAQHFYKALRVYPNPVELLEIYRKTVPEVVPIWSRLCRMRTNRSLGLRTLKK